MASQLKKINFKDKKYIFPLILYALALVAGYLIFDTFNVELAEAPTAMESTDYINPNLPQAQLAREDIGGKYENMAKAYGQIVDHSALESVEQHEEDIKEEYESKYTEEDLALLDEEAERQLREMQQRLNASAELGANMEGADLTEAERMAMGQQRQQEAMEELEKALAETRLQGNKATEQEEPVAAVQVKATVAEEVAVNENAVNQLPDDAETQQVAKAIKPSSSYFNTLSQNEADPKLIKAIIDENIKAVDGSRVRLRLLDDIEIGGVFLEKGSYLYATMSGFGEQRVKGSVKSLMVNDELLKVNLTIYDTDGQEGLYVPQSSFRDATKDIAAGTVGSNMNINTTNTGNSFTQWGMQAIQNAYQQTTNALSKSVSKNKANLKYGTFVYLVNGRDNR